MVAKEEFWRQVMKPIARVVRLAAPQLVLTALIAVVALVVALVPKTSLSAPEVNTRANIQSISMTSQQLKAWQQQVSTPQGRAAVIESVRTAFGGKAQAGFGEAPTFINGRPVTLSASVGANGSYFWFVVSDRDIRAGVGWGLRAACLRLLPLAGFFVCGAIVTAVEGASYGSGTNHGVWGKVYWWGGIHIYRW